MVVTFVTIHRVETVLDSLLDSVLDCNSFPSIGELFARRVSNCVHMVNVMSLVSPTLGRTGHLNVRCVINSNRSTHAIMRYCAENAA
jgi:hypothetical protein